MPRFVILQHDWPQLHWDLLLENGATLRSWRLMQPPKTGVQIRVEATPPHRPAYLDYEGPVSGNRGSVTQYLSGTCEWRGQTPETVEFSLKFQKTAESTGPIEWLVQIQGDAACLDSHDRSPPATGFFFATQTQVF